MSSKGSCLLDEMEAFTLITSTVSDSIRIISFLLSGIRLGALTDSKRNHAAQVSIHTSHSACGKSWDL